MYDNYALWVIGNFLVIFAGETAWTPPCTALQPHGREDQAQRKMSPQNKDFPRLNNWRGKSMGYEAAAVGSRNLRISRVR